VIRRLALLFLPVALGSCTAPATEVEAYFDGDRLAFRVPGEERDRASCFDNFRIIDAHGEPMWELIGGPDPAAGNQADVFICPKNVFPLRYGQAPPSAETVTAPRPLVPGQLYVIQGHAVGDLYGAFRYSQTMVRAVERIDSGSAEARAAEEAYWRNHETPVAIANDQTNETR
jgi:hypothetical protein